MIPGIPEPTHKRTTTVVYRGMNIIVTVLAYRDVADNEVFECFRGFLSANRKKKLMDGLRLRFAPIRRSRPPMKNFHISLDIVMLGRRPLF